MVIYPYPFLVVINQLVSSIIFIHARIFILIGLKRTAHKRATFFLCHAVTKNVQQVCKVRTSKLNQCKVELSRYNMELFDMTKLKYDFFLNGFKFVTFKPNLLLAISPIRT